MFFLGVHITSAQWWEAAVPLCVSRRRMPKRKIPTACAPWILDSGGFSELSEFGEWRTSEDDYVREVERWRSVGQLVWVAPQDWMCEPFVLEKTGGSVAVHQQMTVENFLRLRDRLGPLVIPVLQGWTRDDYHLCWATYEANGVDLEDEPVVGIGSVCRRQNTAEAGEIVRSLAPLRLHGFGVKLTGLESFGDALLSADSMAWSYSARNAAPMRDCSHKSCANCLRYALRWRSNLLERLGQQRMEFAA